MVKTFHEFRMKVFPHRLIVVCVVVYGATDLTRSDENSPAAKPAQTKSQLTASDVQPGLVNDWLRSQSSSFSAWDVGGQFRARYENVERLGGAADFSARGNSSDNLMLLRTLVHLGYNPTPWLSFYAEARDSRGYLDEPSPNPGRTSEEPLTRPSCVTRSKASGWMHLFHVPSLCGTTISMSPMGEICFLEFMLQPRN